MKPALHYRKANPLDGMSRIDMLVALYDRALSHLDQIGPAGETGDDAARALHLFKAQKVIAGLHAGLADGDNPLAGNLARLFEFCQHQIASGKPVQARRTLAMLREAYAAIRDEGNQLESAGAIPPLEITATAFEYSA